MKKKQKIMSKTEISKCISNTFKLNNNFLYNKFRHSCEWQVQLKTNRRFNKYEGNDEKMVLRIMNDLLPIFIEYVKTYKMNKETYNNGKLYDGRNFDNNIFPILRAMKIKKIKSNSKRNDKQIL